MSIIPVSAASAAMFPAAGTSQVGLAEGGQVGPTSPTSPTAPIGAEGSSGAAGSGDSFANILGNAIDGVQSTQANADNLATQAATGSLTNVSDYMVAAEEANIQTQLTSAVRNNALQAFQQIMGMQL
jgi:flagellar hook-basal body complex protein FliE